MGDLIITQADTIGEQEVARRCLQVLHLHYPGYDWEVNCHGGVVEVFNLTLHPNFGFRRKMSELSNDPSLRLIMRAGGELMERFHVTRTRLAMGQLMEMVMARPRGLRDEMLGGDLAK
ncbi:MAG: hypothetical protein HQM00_02245 [Magnetococcales bacterium]|nr:hypothetical protein [Magnetococcales bacterium]